MGKMPIAANAPATIFLGGSWAREEPEHVKELARNSLFELGDHSYSHPHMTKVSAARVHQELQHTQSEIAALTYYLRDRPLRTAAWSANRTPDNQFDLAHPLDNAAPELGLLDVREGFD